MARTLTTANSSFALQVDGLFPVPVNIKGYATDDMFSTAEVETSERMMGADGNLSFGFIFAERPFTFTLQADSLSNDIMDAWIAAEENAKDKLIANAIIILPGQNAKYALTRGCLSTFSVMSEIKKVAQPRKFTLHFQSISRAPT